MRKKLSGVFSVPSDYETEPYTFENTPCLRVETSQGLQLFPYIRFQSAFYQETDPDAEEGQLNIIFDCAVVRVQGFRVDQLVSPLQRQVLFSICAGTSIDVEYPKIFSIEILTSDQMEKF